MSPLFYVLALAAIWVGASMVNRALIRAYERQHDDMVPPIPAAFVTALGPLLGWALLLSVLEGDNHG